MRFYPEEVLFAPTHDCNLRCPHCNLRHDRKSLSPDIAEKFLTKAKRFGIDRVGITGGEPFLRQGFLCKIISKAVKEGMFFDRIMTNGVWYKNSASLKRSLSKLKASGYDGSICVSVDAFHRQDMNKTALFIRAASLIWRRPDIISLAYVGGAKEGATRKKLLKLANILNAKLSLFGKSGCSIKNKELLIKILRIGLSPVGPASKIMTPWSGGWFKDDLCRGPGNVFFIMPNGNVKPCCGYANHLDGLTIGNIRRDSVKDIMDNLNKNRFVFTVFNSGLGSIRRRLKRLNFKFPGKSAHHCHFCEYLLTKVPESIMKRCLD